nr:hypothetical protein [Oscillospiraceae bacterium]
MKFLIKLATFVVCAGILAFGGYQTVIESNIEEMVSAFEVALESTPELPGGTTNPGNPGNSGNSGNSGNHKPDFSISIPSGSDATLNPGTSIKVDAVNEDLSNTVHKNIDVAAGTGKEADLLTVYDIALVLDGASVQPGGDVVVTLPAPENTDGYESLQVVYIDDNGNVTVCETTVNADGTVSFVTDHFSRYAIIGVKAAAHKHRFIEGKCECGEVNPDYVPPHVHNFVDGECKCGESDPTYVPPHTHRFIEGKCECGEINPNYVPETPEHQHSFVEGVCSCGESDPNYVPPHKHRFIEGKCECGEVNPDYVPPHVHKYVDGVCDCGEANPDYVPHQHNFVEGVCDCGESDPNYKAPGLSTEEAKNALDGLYGNYDEAYDEFNKEVFVGMIAGAVGETGNNSGNDSGNPDQGGEDITPPEQDPEEEEEIENDFDATFDDTTYDPNDTTEEDTSVSNESSSIVTSVAGTFYENFTQGIKDNQAANADADEETKQAAREEFVKTESEAVAGLVNIVAKPEETTDEQLVESIEAVLKSDVCMKTVTDSVEKDEEFTTTVQEATQNIDEETKAQIQERIESSLEDFRSSENYDAANERNYTDLAELFGITLENA